MAFVGEAGRAIVPSDFAGELSMVAAAGSLACDCARIVPSSLVTTGARGEAAGAALVSGGVEPRDCTSADTEGGLAICAVVPGLGETVAEGLRKNQIPAELVLAARTLVFFRRCDHARGLRRRLRAGTGRRSKTALRLIGRTIRKLASVASGRANSTLQTLARLSSRHRSLAPCCSAASRHLQGRWSEARSSLPRR